jgi:hypothetical protein
MEKIFGTYEEHLSLKWLVLQIEVNILVPKHGGMQYMEYICEHS